MLFGVLVLIAKPGHATGRFVLAIAQHWIEIEITKLNNWRTLTRIQRKQPLGPESSFVKLFWSEMYQRMLEHAVGLLGPFGVLMHGSERAVDGGRWPHLMLYSRGRTIAAGSSEIQRNIIAERVLGLPR